MHRLNLRAVRRVAGAAYLKWVTNPRMVTVGILLVFVHSFAVQPMRARAAVYGAPINVLEPFLAVCNSSLTALFIPVVFILLMSDFPVMWLFPTANTLIWLHYHELLRQPVTPVSRSFLYFLIANLLLLTANAAAAHRLQFRNTESEGD